MSVRIDGNCAVAKLSAIEQNYRGGLEQALAESHATALAADGTIVAVVFENAEHRDGWLMSLAAHGIDAAERPEWLEIEGDIAWHRGAPRGAIAESKPYRRAPFQRLELLSKSDSGLHYVRERKSGILRQLTDEELRDFNEPPPCPDCGEQFGCDHLNCARERLLSEKEVENEVPAEWRVFARDNGVSREDLARLQSITSTEGEYHLVPNTTSDMRMLELVLLLNESR